VDSLVGAGIRSVGLKRIVATVTTRSRAVGGTIQKLGKLGPGGMRATVKAVRDLTMMISERRPGVPIFFLGHSWGSLIGQMILNQGGAKDYAGVILTGTAYRVPGYMNAGNLNARHKHLGTIGSEWLSRDVKVHEAWRNDPSPLLRTH